MKLYIAYTGTLLLNILNQRANEIHDEVADLYINKSPRMPLDLIDVAKNSNLFRKVVVVTSFSEFVNNHISKIKCNIVSKVGIINKIIYAYNHLLYWSKYYAEILDKLFDNPTYDSIITHGLWLDSVYIVRSAYLKNPHLKIMLIEEGASMWSCGFDMLTNQMTILNFNILQRLLWKIIWFGNTRHRFLYDLKTYQRMISGVYCYVPEYAEICKETKLPGHKLLPLNSGNQLTPLLQALSLATDVSELERRSVIVFTYTEALENDAYHSQFINEIETLFDYWDSSDVLVKGHPRTQLDEKYYCSKYLGVFIDNRKYQLEVIYSRLNLDTKLLITRVSSSVYYPKYMFDKEPYVIFTEYLYGVYTKFNHDIDKMMLDLKKKYRNPEKIYAPKSLDELRAVLKEVSSLISSKTSS